MDHMDARSESVVKGLAGGIVVGLLVGVFLGQTMIGVLLGAIAGIVLGSVLDLDALFRRPAGGRDSARFARSGRGSTGRSGAAGSSHAECKPASGWADEPSWGPREPRRAHAPRPASRRRDGLR